jgi:hypothetical protein
MEARQMKARVRLVCVFLMLGLSGCPLEKGIEAGVEGNDDSDTPSTPALSDAHAGTLLKVTNVGPDDECAAGGTRIDVGTDDDSDGVLDADEIEQYSRVCDGVSGANGEQGNDGADGTAGADGEDGMAGVDGVDGADGADGIDGADGLAGAEGLTSLMRVTADEPSDTCPAGGSLVETGIDDDRDTVLDDAEIDRSALVCNGQDGADGEDAESDDDSCFVEHAADVIRLVCADHTRVLDSHILMPQAATSSSITGGWSAGQAAASDQAGWMSELDSGNPEWLQYDFGTPMVLTQVHAYAVMGRHGVHPVIQGSNDGITWTELVALGNGAGPGAAPWHGYGSMSEPIVTSTAYRYARLYSEPAPFIYYSWLAFEGVVAR